MRGRAVGLYWTLPVPWAGFVALPRDPEAAAEASATIRYQRALVRRHAAAEGWDLVAEIPFMELEPDRGTEVAREPVSEAARLCRAEGAVLLWVDFAVEHGWRGHGPLRDAIARSGTDAVPVPAEPVPVDGVPFDPHAHFAAWRARQTAWTEARPARRAAMVEAARPLRAQGLSWPQVAARLEAMDLPSLTGRPHTADAVRKAVDGTG